MRLAKLTVQGFKSFADKSEFTFNAPITGVVGPNGCGKSNIVDAIKWVLGERSAKSLRGKEMADVIFSGSAGRKPAGMASVILTFDNPTLTAAQLEARRSSMAMRIEEKETDAETPLGTNDDDSVGLTTRDRSRRWLPIDTETVDVERRLYRDGTSQYLINSRKARLRDIRELFLDTGVGADAYSIIEQGKVDALLIANPVERRTFFEEAAGIARFKARRIESQRKLERAESNLLLTREQLESTERRLRIVRGQAAKARRFRELDLDYRSLRMAVAFENYHDLCDRLYGLTSQLQEVEQRRREVVKAVEQFESDRQDADLQRHDCLEEQRSLEATRSEARQRRGAAEQRRTMAERSINETRAQLQSDEERRSRTADRMTDAEEELASQRRSVGQITEAVEGFETKLTECAEVRQSIQSDLADRRLEIAEKRSALADIDRQRTTLLARLDADRRRLSALSEQMEKQESRATTLQRRLDEQQADLHRAEGVVEQRRSQIEHVEGEIQTRVESASSLSADQRQLTEQLNAVEQQCARLDSRRSTLQEMAESREGLDESVKAVLELRDAEREGDLPEEFAPLAGLLRAIRAPLADLIEVDADNAAAVESALGDNLQTLVVDSLASLADCNELELLPGRVSFIAIEDGRREGTDVADLDADLPGRRIRDLIRAGDGVGRVLDRLLGSCRLVPDLDAAMMLRASVTHEPRVRFVTADGALLDADGVVTAGSAAEGAGGGLLQRASELSALEAELERASADRDRRRTELEHLDQRVVELNATLSALRHRLAADQKELVADESRRRHIEADVERIQQELPSLAEDIAHTRGQVETLQQERDQITSRADKLQRLHDEQASVTEMLERDIESSQQKLDEATERQTAVRVEMGQHNEQLNGARREVRRLELTLEEAASELERLAGAVESRREAVVEYEQIIDSASQEITAAENDIQDVEGRLETVAVDLESATQRVREISERLDGARRRVQEVDRDWNALEVTKRELEVRRENLEERTLDEIGVDLHAELLDYACLIADDAITAIEPEVVAPEIEQLRREIQALGNVNLDAIEEETHLASRNEELIQKVADIDEARTRLEELIDRLNIVSRDLFKTAFEQISEHFASKEGMFRKLFGGGRAEIRLIPDAETGEVDWLESGIEVIAKPPGKEPRSINQLSGGEKTMTAVALLMSIFKSKPSPFCVLDEVDAALDDANVERFCHIVRQFLDYCHFIVITHNKRTMQITDQLFGITMQERGVSRKVHVRFDDVNSDGSIREVKPDAAAPTSRPSDALRGNQAVTANG